jgi:hypothetical protein
MFTIDEKILLNVCLDRYERELRQACLEDQGDANGKEGTLGFELIGKINQVRSKIKVW